MPCRLGRGLDFVLVLGVLAAATGCSSDLPTVETARVVVSGEEGVSVLMMTSVDFVAAPTDQGGTDVVVLRADSSVSTLPVDMTFDLSLSQRFLVEVRPPDDESGPAAAMRVLIDGEQKYDESSDDLQQVPLRFAFVFNRAAGDPQVQF